MNTMLTNPQRFVSSCSVSPPRVTDNAEENLSRKIFTSTRLLHATFLHMTLLYCFYVAVSVIWWSTWWKRLISLIRDFTGRLLMGSIITSYLKKSFPVFNSWFDDNLFLDLYGIPCSLKQLVTICSDKFSQYCSLKLVHSENSEWSACGSDISFCVVWTK